jgi:prephenate dehydratase
MLVAYQGVPGAYSEMAARALFPGCRTLPCETFDDVFAAVEKKSADRGVVPVENSLAGSIHQNYDLLVTHPLNVVGEAYVRVEHALMALPGTGPAAVRQVRSHPQALAQCSAFFAANPSVKPVVWYDTAGAARSLVEERPEVIAGIAAIASEDAAKIYGLKILKRRIQNSAHNFTRFLAIARPARPGTKGSKATILAKKSTTSLKTSLTFIPARNRAGVLHAVTGVFAAQGIDLTKVESRPDPENPFDYRFYLDATGGAQEPALKKALAELKKLSRDMRVLGSYPRAKLPSGRGHL